MRAVPDVASAPTRVAMQREPRDDGSDHPAQQEWSDPRVNPGTCALTGPLSYYSDSREVTEVLDVRTGHPVLKVTTDYSDARYTVISPDGKTLALAGDRGIRLYDVRSAALRGQLRLFYISYPARPFVSFSHDSHTLIAGTETDCGTSAVMWDVQTLTPFGRPICVNTDQVAVTTGTESLVGVQSDNPATVTRWDLRPEAWVPIVCSIANRNLTRGEWARYMSDAPYATTCPQFALEP